MTNDKYKRERHIYVFVYVHSHYVLRDYMCVYIYIWYPPPLTYPLVSFETQGWVGAGASGIERRPENAID